MQKKRPRINNLIPNRQPRRPRLRRRRIKGIPNLRRLEIEALGDMLHRLCHGGVVEVAVALADDEEFVGMFVHGVGWLDGGFDDHD